MTGTETAGFRRCYCSPARTPGCPCSPSSSSACSRTTEAEGARIARDLQDLLGHSLTAITVKSTSATDVVAPDRQELFGWVVREGLPNVARHARASPVQRHPFGRFRRGGRRRRGRGGERTAASSCSRRSAAWLPAARDGGGRRRVRGEGRARRSAGRRDPPANATSSSRPGRRHDRRNRFALYLSEGTVRNYVSAVITKTGARNRVEPVRIADERDWL